jgi:hypothetical protein
MRLAAAERVRAGKGWYRPQDARVAHYYDTNDRPLCAAGGALTPPDSSEGINAAAKPDDCVVCRRKVDAARSRLSFSSTVWSWAGAVLFVGGPVLGIAAIVAGIWFTFAISPWWLLALPAGVIGGLVLHGGGLGGLFYAEELNPRSQEPLAMHPDTPKQRAKAAKFIDRVVAREQRYSSVPSRSSQSPNEYWTQTIHMLRHRYENPEWYVQYLLATRREAGLPELVCPDPKPSKWYDQYVEFSFPTWPVSPRRQRGRQHRSS